MWCSVEYVCTWFNDGPCTIHAPFDFDNSRNAMEHWFTGFFSCVGHRLTFLPFSFLAGSPLSFLLSFSPSTVSSVYHPLREITRMADPTRLLPGCVVSNVGTSGRRPWNVQWWTRDYISWYRERCRYLLIWENESKKKKKNYRKISFLFLIRLIAVVNLYSWSRFILDWTIDFDWKKKINQWKNIVLFIGFHRCG